MSKCIFFFFFRPRKKRGLYFSRNFSVFGPGEVLKAPHKIFEEALTKKKNGPRLYRSTRRHFKNKPQKGPPPAAARVQSKAREALIAD